MAAPPYPSQAPETSRRTRFGIYARAGGTGSVSVINNSGNAAGTISGRHLRHLCQRCRRRRCHGRQHRRYLKQHDSRHARHLCAQLRCRHRQGDQRRQCHHPGHRNLCAIERRRKCTIESTGRHQVDDAHRPIRRLGQRQRLHHEQRHRQHIRLGDLRRIDQRRDLDRKHRRRHVIGVWAQIAGWHEQQRYGEQRQRLRLLRRRAVHGRLRRQHAQQLWRPLYVDH